MVRKSLICAICALCLSPTAAFGRTEIVHREFVQEFNGPARYCSFPVTTSWRAEHWQTFHYAGVPDGWSPNSPDRFFYQVSGHHFIDARETVTNPANGASIDIHAVVNLIRRDMDNSGLTIDSDGRVTGEARAIDHESYSVVGTAPGEGNVVLRAGHQRRYHTSFFVDGTRVGRSDVPFFHAGPVVDELCSYLSST